MSSSPRRDYREASPSIRRSRSRPSAPLHPLIQKHQDSTTYIGCTAEPCYVEKAGSNVKYSVESSCSAKLKFTKPIGSSDSFFRCLAKVKDVVWVAETDGSISIRDAKTAEVKRVIETSGLASSLSARVQVTSDSYCTRAPGHILSLLAVADKVWAGANDGKVHIYSLAGRREVELKHHTGPITSLVEAHGKVYSGSSDFKICMWDVVKQSFVKMLHGHKMAVRCLRASDALLFSGSDDKTVNVWSLAQQGQGQGQGPLKTLTGHRGDVLALDTCAGHLWSGSVDCSIRVWNYQTGECKAVLPHHTGWVHVLRAMGNKVWSASHDGSICIWSGKTMSLLHKIESPHEGLLQDVALTQVTTETLLWSIGGDQVVRFWNVHEVNKEDYKEWDGLEAGKEKMLLLENGIAEHQTKNLRLMEMLETAHGLLVKEKEEREAVAARVSQLECEIEEKNQQVDHMTKGFEALAEKHDKMRVMSNVFRDNVQAMLDERRQTSESPDNWNTLPPGADLKKAFVKIQELKEDNNRLLNALQGGDNEKLSEEVKRLQQLLEMRTCIVESLKKKRSEGTVLTGGIDDDPMEYTPHLANPLETGDEVLKGIHLKDMLDTTIRQLSRKCSVLKAVLPMLGDDAGHLKDLVEHEANNFGVSECEVGLDTGSTTAMSLEAELAQGATLDIDRFSKMQAALHHTESTYKAKLDQLKAHLAEREGELQTLRKQLVSRPQPTSFNDTEFNKDSLEIELAATVAEKAIAEQTQDQLQQDVRELTEQLREKDEQVCSLTELLQQKEAVTTGSHESLMTLQKCLDETALKCDELQEEKAQMEKTLQHMFIRSASVEVAINDTVEVAQVQSCDGNLVTVLCCGLTMDLPVSSIRSFKLRKEEELQEEVTKLETEMQTMENDQKSLKSSITGLEEELKLSTGSHSRVDQLEDMLETAEQKNRQLKEQMKSRVKMIEEGLAEAKQARVEKDAETSRLQHETEQLSIELQKEQDARDQLLSEIQLLKEELSLAKNRAASLSQHDEVEKVEKKLSSAQQNMSDLYSELQDANCTIDDLRAASMGHSAISSQLSVERERTMALGRQLELSEGKVREVELRLQLQDKEVELLKMKLERQPKKERMGEDSLTVSSEPSPKHRQPSLPKSEPRSEAEDTRASLQTARSNMDELRAQVDEAQKRASETQQTAEHLRSQTRQLLPHAVPVRVLKTKKFKSGKVVEEGSTGVILRTEGDQAGTMRVRMDVGDVVFDFKTSDLEILERSSSPAPLPPPPMSPHSPKNPHLGPMIRLKSAVQSGSKTWPVGTWAHALLHDEDTQSCALQMIHNNNVPNMQPQFAHEVANSKIDFVDLPVKLYVTIPHKSPADGCYVLVEGVLHNGLPMWMAGDRIIRANQYNAWMIGDVKELSNGAGWAVSKYPHDGLFPHLVDIWQTFVNPSEPWTDDLTVRVSLRPLIRGDDTVHRHAMSPRTSPAIEAQNAAKALSKISTSGSWRKQASQARSLPRSPSCT